MTTPNAPGISRRRFVGAAGLGMTSVAGLAACAGSGSSSSPASAGGGLADAVFEAFKTHRLVALGEWHDLQDHFDAVTPLLTDPRLPDVVDDIVVEYGNALYQDTIDRFIAGQPVDDAELRPVWRNTTQSPLETYDGPVYEQFFRAVRAVNWTLPPGKQIRVLLGDPPIDWSKITNRAEMLPFGGPLRAGYPASLVHQQVLAKGHRALICYGWWFVLHGSPNSLIGRIEQQTGERTYTIADLVPLDGDPGGLARKLSRHPRNTVIPAAGTWLGSFDAGLTPPSIDKTPNGPPTNPWCGTRLGSLIDAGLYLGQPGELTQTWPDPAIYLDPAYWSELKRRNALGGDGVDLDSYRQEHSARYELLALPPAQECGQAT
jgi:hypothetical protein